MKNVLYVPLDDRPVNLDDVIMQGRSAGLNVITPCRSDIRNRLDTEKIAAGGILESTSSPAVGHPDNIRRFILRHAGAADGFIISTDMLVYGGLIGSRRLRANGGGIYPDYDPAAAKRLDVIRLVKQSCPGKPIYVLDTIMRLATTTFVDGLTYEAYTESRSFMQQPRKSFTAFDDILQGYDLSPDGSYGGTVHFDKEQYYNARRHKFKTNYYILEQLARQGYIDFLAIGVDDAYTQGAQLNEIRFIEGRINAWLGGGASGQNPDRAIILPDADGLGHALMARMANQLHRGGTKPRYAVRYYGPDGSTITSPYEYMNVDDNIRRHVDIIGGQRVPCSPDIEIIAITAPEQVSAAISRLEANVSNRIPTVAIDFAGRGPANAAVTEALLDSRHTGCLLGYSAWNTPGNKIGIALGMGQARYAFLVTENRPAALDRAVNAHGSLLFKRFLKDYYYKTTAIGEIRTYSRKHCMYSNIASMADQNMRLFNTAADYAFLLAILRTRMQTHTATLAGKNAFLAGCPGAAQNVRQIRGSLWSLAAYSHVSLDDDNPDFMWGRAFEITLQPAAALH
ncbi:DUF4127 family protein [Paenibacillus thiaminolyticus]|uniref:DUF4127 family protein n=1 Tax=Paenibacillus thiaminolyticus TaxID=49283 RepID=A0AAP9DXM5_PANTH|nr:DUF4127 family protein [Paenibacillus thiaminolyticus]MCY9536123.1 DUF4127 family protein [Paenibacillus thiaminolyticus]MCY9603612.1 DUF4127 family protein [Paenibacillus thiaminolyticus]MCY9605746.1 DUF4127 family protein [Paenibacillus thiaminolyticus]MCY9611753.1 DUF4127 family protein [Paenibacillus thiaminolyticus]MCY9621048.1 DUF4127 family protein [Paenibacillus thiaminolyticus]